MRAAAALALTLVCPAAIAEVPAEKHEKVGRAVMTFYWIIDETSSRYQGEPNAVLRDPRGRVIAHVRKRFKIDLVREGTGWLKDGRTVIFDRKVDGESRFRVVGARYGLSVTGCPLIPFRTVAVDPHFVKLGSTIYIPQLKGMQLPDGTIHDGMFIAADRGHFRGAHVDMFIGAGTKGVRPFYRKGYGSRSHVTVYFAGRADRCKP